MNYKDENDSPRDRISRELFFKEYGRFPREEDKEHSENAPTERFSVERSVIPSAPLGIVYAPNQMFRELYDPEEALVSGTLFKELDLPFYPGGEKRRNAI